MAATATGKENEVLARRIPEEVATEGRLDVLDEICAPDVVDHGPFGVVRGRAELKEQMEGIRAAIPDFKAKVVDAISEGDTVAIRVELSGSHEGDLMGLPATGKSFTMNNMVFTRIEDGMIVERWVQPDMLGMLDQLGVVDSPFENQSD